MENLRWFWLLAFMTPTLSSFAEPVVITYRTQEFNYENLSVPLRVPEGFEVELLSDALDGPRLFAFGPAGELVVASKSGNVYRLQAPYTEVEVLTRLSDYPHSVAFRGGKLLVARNDGVYAAAYYPDRKVINRNEFVLLGALPRGGGHSSRSIGVGPDGRIYASLGISSNCSDEYLGKPYSFGKRRGGVLVLDEGESPHQWRTYASGLRNPVGFDWQPHTGLLFASNNGPDHLGFELPPEYFSALTEGSFHGMPWYQYDGQGLLRDECISGDPPRPMQDVSLPVATFPARNAPMGVAFVPPGTLAGFINADAVVALRGSWGTAPSGSHLGDPATRREPKLVVVRFDNGQATRVDDLISGFQMPDGQRWARPVGVGVGPDGALYFTSDEGINGLFRFKPIAP